MMNRIRHNQLIQLISAQFKDIIRHPAVIFWGIIFPILMSLGLGIAFTRKSDIVRQVAVIGQEQNPSSAGPSSGTDSRMIMDFLRHHAEKMESNDTVSPAHRITLKDDKLGNTIFVFRQATWHQAMSLLKRGNLSVIMDESRGEIQYHFDPLNPDAQFTYYKLSGIFNETAVTASTDVILPLTVSGTRYIDFLVPGLMAMGIMMSCMWGMSYGTIDKRSKKLLRRMVATPMKKSYFLIALMMVRILMNAIEASLLFLFAWLVFHVTIQGSLLGLLIIFLSGNIAFGGIAIFVSSRTDNTEIGNGLVNAVVMPMMVLSGIFFSYHNFPDWSIPVIQKLPLTLLADGLRGVFIEGAGFTDVLAPTAAMLTIGVVFFSAGLKVFKWH
ncbi:MAG: ABC transporter permease [Desulfobacteraceae bacterium]|nr:MAG: ABC transporter permease [Desulfobacteraceae bacterium]